MKAQARVRATSSAECSARSRALAAFGVERDDRSCNCG